MNDWICPMACGAVFPAFIGVMQLPSAHEYVVMVASAEFMHMLANDAVAPPVFHTERVSVPAAHPTKIELAFPASARRPSELESNEGPFVLTQNEGG